MAGILAVQLIAPQARPDLHLASGVLAARALERPTAGISIAVARRSSTPFVVRAFGFADVANKTPAVPNTVFRSVSLQEYVEAAIVLRLADEHKLALDEDVRTYVPRAPMQDRRVTVAHLLARTSGMPEGNGPFHFTPGDGWRQSVAGYALLREAVERVTGQPYASYARDTIFVPLRMTSTSICSSRDSITGVATGYQAIDDTLMAVEPPASLPALCTTARDLLAFERALNAGAVLSGPGLGRMRAATLLPDGTSIPYGLGSARGSLQGHPVLGHAGSGAGTSAAILTFPDDGLTISVLTNTANESAAPLAAAIARSAFEIAAPKGGTAVPADERDALAAAYESALGTTTLVACEEKLCARASATGTVRELTRLAPRVYLRDAEVELRLDDKPRPEWMFVYSGGLMIDAKRRVP